VYAVRTTGIFCRPSCASRAPRRENVAFYDSPEDAVAAGFRACKRCRPGEDDPARDAAKRVVAACRALEADAVSNGALADAAGLAETYFLRVFKAHTGVSPQAYRRRVLAERARESLGDAPTVVDGAIDAGYRSSTRFYDTVGRELGMPPASVLDKGKGESVSYAVRACALGRVLVAWTARGVCDIGFADDDAALIDDLRRRLPKATLASDDVPRWVDDAIDVVDHGRVPGIPLDIQGTAFQERVWAELRRIPSGETRTYADVARAIGEPSAHRAVARACATNRVAVIIPCHRVVRADGGLSGYRWGPDRKRRLLERER
jgi:AraC family transcriptional regulator of adaptative response/methylated-DNA-[protein]-cysteine methyltransferase